RRVQHVRPNPMRLSDAVHAPSGHISVITIVGQFLSVKHGKQPVPKMIGIRIVDRGGGRCRAWCVRFSLSAGQAVLSHAHEDAQDNRPTNRSPNRMAQLIDLSLRTFIMLFLSDRNYSNELPKCQTFVK